MLSPCAVHRSGIRTAQQLRSHSRLSRAVQHAPTRSRSLTLGVVSRAKEEGPKRLVLLRHAKSEWEVPEIDRDRPLALRGHKEAAEMGRKLAKRGKWHPDVILVSDSLRTRETLDLVFERAPKLRRRAATHVVPLIYETSHGDANSEKNLATNLMEALTMFIEGARIQDKTIWIVGHNDGLQALASLLSGVDVTLKTADAALLKSKADTWHDAIAGAWRLKDVVTTHNKEKSGKKQKRRDGAERGGGEAEEALSVSMRLNNGGFGVAGPAPAAAAESAAETTPNAGKQEGTAAAAAEEKGEERYRRRPGSKKGGGAGTPAEGEPRRRRTDS